MQILAVCRERQISQSFHGAHVVSIQQVQQWQYPYPPPEDIKEYEAVLPGAFDRMMKMA